MKLPDLLVSAFSALHKTMRRDFLAAGAMSSRMNEDDPKAVAKFAVECADEAIMDSKKQRERRF